MHIIAKLDHRQGTNLHIETCVWIWWNRDAGLSNVIPISNILIVMWTHGWQHISYPYIVSSILRPWRRGIFGYWLVCSWSAEMFLPNLLAILKMPSGQWKRMVIFLQITHERRTIARPLRRGMGCRREFKVWSMFYFAVVGDCPTPCYAQPQYIVSLQ